MKDILLKIKPLSVNQAYTGERHRTTKYNRYKKAVLLMLPKKEINPEKKLSVFIEYGFSSHSSDIDNPNKPLLDIMQEKYGFNDNQVYRLNTHKRIVKKGREYIYIKIKEYEK